MGALAHLLEHGGLVVSEGEQEFEPEVEQGDIKSGGAGEFGRHIELELVQAEVPVHYLLNFSTDRMAESVNQGVIAARDWCRENGIELRSSRPSVSPMPPEECSGISFTEQMKGHTTQGIDEPVSGETAELRENTSFELAIRVDDIEVFATDPRHYAGATGWVDVPSLGGRRTVERGTFQLFVDESNPDSKRMLYRLWFAAESGEPFTLSGEKLVHDDPGLDLWSDTTTLFIRIFRGHVEASDDDTAAIWGAGVLHIHSADFLRQLGTMRAHGPDIRRRALAAQRFTRQFLGKLWDSYGRAQVPFGPT